MFQRIVHTADINYSLFITIQDPTIKLAPLSAGWKKTEVSHVKMLRCPTVALSKHRSLLNELDLRGFWNRLMFWRLPLLNKDLIAAKGRSLEKKFFRELPERKHLSWERHSIHGFLLLWTSNCLALYFVTRWYYQLNWKHMMTMRRWGEVRMSRAYLVIWWD